MDSQEKISETLEVGGLSLYVRTLEPGELRQLAAYIDGEGDWDVAREDVAFMYGHFRRDFLGAFSAEGLLIGCCVNFILDDHVTHVGWYVTSPAHRGRGVGRALFDLATSARRVGGRTVTLDAVYATSAMYRKSGYVSTDVIKQSVKGVPMITDDTRCDVMRSVPDVKIERISSSNVDQVLAYDRDITSTAVPDFKRSWILDSNSVAKCAIMNSSVVGYVIVRKESRENAPFNMSSFYADDVNYARALIYDVIREIPSGKSLKGYFPLCNVHADELLAEVGLVERESTDVLELMYIGSPIRPVAWQSVYCVTDNSIHV